MYYQDFNGVLISSQDVSSLSLFPAWLLYENACAVRTGLNRDLGFSPADRAESVRRVGEMACLFSGGGVITLVTLVSPYQVLAEMRLKKTARRRCSKGCIIFTAMCTHVHIHMY